MLSSKNGPAPSITWLFAVSNASTHKYLFPVSPFSVTSLLFFNGFVICDASGLVSFCVHKYFNELSSKFVSDTLTFVDWDLAGVVFCSGVNVIFGNVLSKLNELFVFVTTIFPAASATYTHK